MHPSISGGVGQEVAKIPMAINMGLKFEVSYLKNTSMNVCADF